MTVAGWAERTGLTVHAINSRLARGRTVEQALATAEGR
jgi:hypothetical protein